ncbi:MAG: phenylalanine--tRNA ligase subunit beta [Bacteroidales bacterium]|nr:phenylalanine--tRNA ligase subunit beta [Candidatus Scybalousia scybalohippi]
MKISYNWLREYVPTTQSAENVAKLLTFSGLEVEGLEKVESIKGGLDKYFVGHVLTCEAHPNSDHLHITTVDVGEGRILNIVCGAPNIAAGQKVVVATVGAVVYDEEGSFTIKKSKLRGAESEGMICSEKELQLGNNHDGILVLPAEAKEGTPAKEYFNIKEDTILEIGLTANRSDATSHLGVGRDLVAILASQVKEQQPLNIPSVEAFKVDEVTEQVSINIDTNLCGRYSGLVIKGVEVKESPAWLKEHLNAIGIRPINNIVDITNFVLMETGQPLHAFDWDKVDGKSINVKTLDKGTKFVTLDGIERELNGKEALVCSATQPMCLGGIFGGKDSGITEQTTNIFVESAYFNPVVIRKAARFHGLQTDASFRYERGADPNITIYALKRAALLIKELAGGKISSEINDVYPTEIKRARIELSYSYLDTLIGQTIERGEIENILNGLNIEIESKNEEGLVALIPTNKVDVTRPCDLAEEILRIYGYDKINFSEQIRSSVNYIQKPDREKVQNTITSYLADNGFNETMNNSLTKVAYYEDNKDFPIEKSVQIINALSKDLALMRQTLLYGGLEVLSYNINRKVSDIKIFEFGNCYEKSLNCPDDQPVDKRYKEEKHLSMLTTGKAAQESWQGKQQDTDFFYLKNMVMNVLRRLRVNEDKLEIKEAEADYLQQGIVIINKENKKQVAILGILSQKVKKAFDIKQNGFYADLNWNTVLKMLPKKEVTYENISKFPEVRRDLALVLDEQVSFAEIEKVAFEVEKKLLKKVNLFDEYRGMNLAGKKQYAVSFILQDEQRTLNDKQIDAIMDKLLKAFETKLGAKLR